MDLEKEIKKIDKFFSNMSTEEFEAMMDRCGINEIKFTNGSVIKTDGRTGKVVRGKMRDYVWKINDKEFSEDVYELKRLSDLATIESLQTYTTSDGKKPKHLD